MGKYTPKVPVDEIIDLFDKFVNLTGQWQNFKKFVEDQGYTIEELGFEDDE